MAAFPPLLWVLKAAIINVHNKTTHKTINEGAEENMKTNYMRIKQRGNMALIKTSAIKVAVKAIGYQ